MNTVKEICETAGVNRSTFRRTGSVCVHPHSGPLPCAPGDREYILAFYIRGLMAIIDRWLRDDCRDSIGHIVAVMQQCTKRVPE